MHSSPLLSTCPSCTPYTHPFIGVLRPWLGDMLYGAYISSSAFVIATPVFSIHHSTHQYLLGVADAPRQIANIAIGLHHLGRKLYAEPTPS
jgi:hypothetical protein